MQQLYQRPEPPRKSFMEQAGWPIITAVISSIIVFVLTVWIVKVQVIDFSWALLIIGCVMIGIMSFCVIFSIRTRRQLQEQYVKDIDKVRRDYLKYKTETMNLRTQETEQWNNWVISFTQANAQEQKEHSEKLESKCMEAIRDAENKMDSSIKNTQSIFSGAVDSNNRAVTLYGEQLIHAQRQMLALEERLRQELKPKDEEQST